jgi:hypothetical protein
VARVNAAPPVSCVHPSRTHACGLHRRFTGSVYSLIIRDCSCVKSVMIKFLGVGQEGYSLCSHACGAFLLSPRRPPAADARPAFPSPQSPQPDGTRMGTWGMFQKILKEEGPAGFLTGIGARALYWCAATAPPPRLCPQLSTLMQRARPKAAPKTCRQRSSDRPFNKCLLAHIRHGVPVTTNAQTISTTLRVAPAKSSLDHSPKGAR